MAASQLCRYESGRNQPGLRTLARITHVLNITLLDFFQRESGSGRTRERGDMLVGRTSRRRRASQAKTCPVSRVPCEDYRDCNRRNYCWLKSQELNHAAQSSGTGT